MEFVLLFTQPKGAPAPDPASLAAGRAEMGKLARELPHARWSPVEVREILFFDRV
jgi:hypothetical protein